MENSRIKILIKKIISAVKEKQELSRIPDSYIEEELQKYLVKKGFKDEKIADLSEKEIKLIVKDIRSILRLSVGRYRRSSKLQLQLLNKGAIIELLKTHSSTAERISFYPEINKIILDLKVKSILDLACGLNPLAIAMPSIKYYALDINESDIEIVKKYFKISKVKGKAFVYDLRKIRENDFPQVDLCIALKILDIIEKKNHNIAEKILQFSRCRYFLVSFSTKTLSGKKMEFPQRPWFEQLLDKLDFKYKIIKSDNEIFYLASRKE